MIKEYRRSKGKQVFKKKPPYPGTDVQTKEQKFYALWFGQREETLFSQFLDKKIGTIRNSNLIVSALTS